MCCIIMSRFIIYGYKHKATSRSRHEDSVLVDDDNYINYYGLCKEDIHINEIICMKNSL